MTVIVGVPEEPKEGTAETSSKFSGSIYLKNPFDSYYLMKMCMIYELFILYSNVILVLY